VVASTADGEHHTRITPFIFVMVAFVSLGGLLFGLDQGNWGGAISKKEFIKCFCGKQPECNEPDNLPPEYASFLSLGSALLQAGACFGSMALAPPLAEHGGRRETMFVGCLLTICGVLPQMFTYVRTFFLCARVVCGLGVGMVTYVLPMFISELAPPSIRGALGSSMQFMVSFAILLASILNAQDWFGHTASFALPIYPAVVVALGIFCFPNSPRHVLLKCQREGSPKKGQELARAALVQLRGTQQAAEAELAQITTALAADGVDAAPWSVLWGDWSIRRRLIIAVMLQIMQQFTGVNAIASYGPSLFQSCGVPLSGLRCAVLVNVFGLSGGLAMMIVIDYFGRRFLLLVGAAAMSVFQISAGILAYLLHQRKSIDEATQGDTGETLLMGWALVACIVLYIFFFAAAWGGVPWVYPSEIFPMDVKERALSISTCAQWLANFVIAYMVPQQVRYMKAHGTFIFYGVCLALSCVYVYFFVPETKGLPLEKMNELFGEEAESSEDSYSSQEEDAAVLGKVPPKA